MSTIPGTTVPLKADLARALTEQATKHGMSLQTYIAFIARVNLRRLDREFTAATRATFNKFPETLRKLSQ